MTFAFYIMAIYLWIHKWWFFPLSWSKTTWRWCRFENLEWKDSPPHSNSHILQSLGSGRIWKSVNIACWLGFCSSCQPSQIPTFSCHHPSHRTGDCWGLPMPLQGVSPCHTAQTTWLKQHLEESLRSGQEGGITDVPFFLSQTQKNFYFF